MRITLFNSVHAFGMCEDNELPTETMCMKLLKEKIYEGRIGLDGKNSVLIIHNYKFNKKESKWKQCAIEIIFYE